LPLGLVMVEPGTGDYIFSNREAKKFFATDQPVEADTQSYRSTVHITDLSGNPVKPDQHPSVRAARGEKLVNEQVIRKNSAGSTYISCYSESLPAMFGHPETVIVPFIDVTSQKLAERELLDSQDRLLSLFQQAPLPICIMDGPEHKFVLMNPYYKTLLGEREMVGKTVREGLPELEGQGFFELLDGVYKTGLAHEGVEVQTHLTGKDGKLREAFFNFIYKPIFNAAGKVTGVMSVANDVTIQVVSRRIIQESEQNLRELADSMPQFVWAANPDGTLYYTNERWAAYSGSNDPSEWLSFVHPDDVARAVDVWMNSVRTGQLYEIEFRLKKADSQKYRWHLVRARPVRDSSGQIKRWYGTCTDIDEQREIQAELLSAKNQADTANQLKTAFLANMSHEIRTPLGAILGFTELLRTPSLSKSEHEQYLDVVARNGKALTRLIDDILDLSKVEAGRLNVEMVPFSLKQLINETVELFEDVSRTKGLSVEIIDPIPEMIESDPTRLRQILINILGNAIKFTQHGGVKIKASHELIEGKSKISIRVIDTGVGIETDQIAHLFQPFRQADNSTSRKFGGTGLGLALSRRLARALGGDVLISDCHEGHGCTFVINLVARLIDHVSTAKPPSRAVAPPATRRLDDLKILVIDDAADNRLLIKYILNHEGANVVEASDGDEGIARALHHQFDVVLMDIQMPGLDGYDCIRLLREQNYTKPVIALTAHAMKEERDRSLSSGFDDHVTKPIQKDVLVQSILKQISNKSSSSQLQV